MTLVSAKVEATCFSLPSYPVPLTPEAGTPKEMFSFNTELWWYLSWSDLPFWFALGFPCFSAESLPSLGTLCPG